MDLKGCAAIVTGGNGGLGRRIGRGLALQGVHVAAVYNQSKEATEEVAQDLSALGPRAVAIQADVTDPAQVARMVEQTQKEFGRVDILVNNGAFNKWVAFPDLDALTLDLWEHILKTNLTGPFNCIKAVAPVMRAQKRGRIMNIASIAGLNPSGSSIAYAVSKAGLIHLTRCMAVALAPHVNVNCIAPGFIEGTRMTANLDPEYRARAADLNALKRPAEKDDIENQIVAFAKSDTTTGQTLVIDAGRIYH